MSDEQRVRTMAGWVGVEISRSRVRTPGKAGYGLYRVRGSRPIARALGTLGPDMKSCEWMSWTAYAFTLGEIQTEIEIAIQVGIPAGPSDLWLRPAGGGLPVGVTTRWTSAYRGRRDMGVSEAQRAQTRALGASLETDTVRSRQRAHNTAFQAEHLERRRYGLKARHAAKLARNAKLRNDEGAP
jgi:hypothetical protein